MLDIHFCNKSDGKVSAEPARIHRARNNKKPTYQKWLTKNGWNPEWLHGCRKTVEKHRVRGEGLLCLRPPGLRQAE